MFIKCNICANRCYKKPTRQHFGRIGFVAITIIDKISDKTILTPLLYYPRSYSGWLRCHASKKNTDCGFTVDVFGLLFGFPLFTQILYRENNGNRYT